MATQILSVTLPKELPLVYAFINVTRLEVSRQTSPQ